MFCKGALTRVCRGLLVWYTFGIKKKSVLIRARIKKFATQEFAVFRKNRKEATRFVNFLGKCFKCQGIMKIINFE